MQLLFLDCNKHAGQHEDLQHAKTDFHVICLNAHGNVAEMVASDT